VFIQHEKAENFIKIDFVIEKFSHQRFFIPFHRIARAGKWMWLTI
jgi:hypothetical protein